MSAMVSTPLTEPYEWEQIESYEWKLAMYNPFTKTSWNEFKTKKSPIFTTQSATGDEVRQWKMRLERRESSKKYSLSLKSYNDGVITVVVSIDAAFRVWIPSDSTKGSTDKRWFNPSNVVRTPLLSQIVGKKFRYGKCAEVVFSENVIRCIPTSTRELCFQCNIRELPPDSDTGTQLISDYETLLKNSNYSDFVLKVGEKEFKVHRNILAMRSSVFKAMFEGNSSSMDAQNIIIDDIDAEVIEAMIGYMYTGKVSNLLKTSAEQLCVAAHKYGLKELKQICEEQISTELTEENVFTKLSFANSFDCSVLKTETVGFLRRHIKQISTTEWFKNMTPSLENMTILKEILLE